MWVVYAALIALVWAAIAIFAFSLARVASKPTPPPSESKSPEPDLHWRGGWRI